MPEHVEVTTIERTITCRSCGSSDAFKYGKRRGVQYYICNNCKKKFAGTDGYPRMKYPREFAIKAITYYYNGMSYKNINHTFSDLKGISVAKSTIWRWVLKYSKMANQYVLTFHPRLSDVWIADETVVDVWGEHYWLWDIIDTETRFLIASHLSRDRTMRDALKLFYMAKLRSATRPKAIITDKLGQYNKAFNKVFYSNIPERRAYHLQSEGFASPTNINLIERFHGTIKQRTKIMRDLKEKYSARIVLDGYITHYNFFLEHEYLKGRTPATAGGIDEGIRNWGDLIDMALMKPRKNPEVRLEWEETFGIA